MSAQTPRTIQAGIVACILLFVTTPALPVHADEEATLAYNGGAARVLGIGAGFVLLPFGEDIDDDGENEIHAIGGGALSTNGTTYRNVHVAISDDLFGARGGFNACMYNPEGDLICNDDDHHTGTGCGPRFLRDAPFDVDFVNVFVYSLVVTDRLEVCGATRGTITATFS